MEAKDLRIGNWVNDDSCHDWQITLSDFYNMYLDDDCPFTPIPLTEEWLVKFGFEKDSFGCLYFGYFYYRKSLFYSSGEFSNIGLPNIQYVHQLQNIYFALTGEELTIK